jgi:hypothetical protein
MKNELRDRRSAIMAVVLPCSAAVAAVGGGLAAPPPAQAAVFRVGSDGACTHSTVQGALDAAKANGVGLDVIAIANNQSYGSSQLAILSHAVHLIGGFSSCAAYPGPNTKTTLDGAGTGVGVMLIAGTVGFHEVILEDLTIRGAADPAIDGGGIQITGSFAVTLRNTSVTGNSGFRGGGILIDGFGGATLSLEAGSAVTSNSASDDGGGIYCWRGGSVVLEPGTAVSLNTAEGDGGGVYLDDCDLVSHAGGLFQGIVGNEAFFGGGIYAHERSQVWLVAEATTGGAEAPATVSGNEARTGGGVYLRGPGTAMVARNASVTGNVALFDGGGLQVENYASLAMERTLGADCHDAVRCSRSSGNTAGLHGGALSLHLATATIRQTFIEDNDAGLGSVAYFGHSSAVGTHLLLDGTVITGNDGFNDLIVPHGFSELDMRFVTVADNDLSSGAAVIRATADSIDLYSSIVRESTGVVLGSLPPFGTTVVVDCLVAHESSSVLSADPDARAVAVFDPLFVSPATGDYHLSAASNAVDYCDDAFTGAGSPDIEGQARGVNDSAASDNLPGGWFDAGADERSSGPSVFGLVFYDGFESGGTAAWSSTVP